MRIHSMTALAIALAGCVVPPQAGFDDVERSLRPRLGARVRWSRGEEDRGVAEETRRLLGRPLTVESAVQLALFHDPELQATYERLGVAQAEVVQAGLLRNPRFSFHWGFRVAAPGVDEILGSVTGAFLDLLLMPLKKKLARAEFRRVKLEVADAVLAKVDQVAQAFYTVQASTQVVAMRRTMLEAQEAAAELAERQHQAGNLSELELASEKAVYLQAKLELARAEHRLAGDREQLTRLLGVWGEDLEYQVAPELPELPAKEPELGELERVAIAQRFDVAAAREEVAGVRQALRLTKGTRVIGGLDVGVNAHRDPDGPATVGPTFDFELPIFDQKQAEVARLEALLRAAQRRAEGLELRVRSEVRQARNRLLGARAVIEAYRGELMPLRERIVGLSQEHYNAMLLGTYQLLQAKQNEIDAYREYIETVRDYWIARADLERAIGARLPVPVDGKGDAK